MTHIPDLVAELIGPHLHRTATKEGTTYGMEEGLLLQLEEAIGSSVSSVSGGGSDPRTRSPIDLGAVDLFNGIVKVVNSKVPPLWRQMPLAARIQYWEGQAYTDEDQDELSRHLELWIEQIRETLDPTPRRPLPGVSCPECLTAVLPRILDGEHVLVPVITIWPQTLVAECQSCEAHWSGQSALMELACRQPKGEV